MKTALFLTLISLSAFAGTTKIRVCPYWMYRTDLKTWTCDAMPKWIEVVTPATSEEPQEEKPNESDKDSKPEATR